MSSVTVAWRETDHERLPPIRHGILSSMAAILVRAGACTDNRRLAVAPRISALGGIPDKPVEAAQVSD